MKITVPTPLEFDNLFARYLRGDSEAMEARNNLQLSKLADGRAVLSNRTGDFAYLDNDDKANVYAAVEVALTAEAARFGFRGNLPHYCHVRREWQE